MEDILTHELGGHKRHWESVYKYYERNACKSISIAKQEFEVRLREYIVNQMNLNPFYLREVVSDNAFQQFTYKKLLNECVADATILIEKDVLQDETLGKLINEVIDYDGDAK